MTNISTLPELRAEIRRLRTLQHQQEGIIDQDVYEITESLKPENIISGVFSSFMKSKGPKEAILHGGVNSTVDFLIDKVLFRKSSFILRWAASAVAKKFSNNIVDKNAGGIFGKVQDIFSNLKNKFTHQNEAGADYHHQSPRRQAYNNEY